MFKTIDELNTDIINTSIIDHWGGFCNNHTDGKRGPYGRGLQPSNIGSIYGNDDNHNVSGYMFLDSLKESSLGIGGSVNVIYREVKIHVYTKITNGVIKDFGKGIQLAYALKRKKYNVSINIGEVKDCTECNYSIITVKLMVSEDC